jgi:hypothetical protein
VLQDERDCAVEGERLGGYLAADLEPATALSACSGELIIGGITMCGGLPCPRKGFYARLGGFGGLTKTTMKLGPVA